MAEIKYLGSGGNYPAGTVVVGDAVVVFALLGANVVFPLSDG